MAQVGNGAVLLYTELELLALVDPLSQLLRTLKERGQRNAEGAGATEGNYSLSLLAAS